MLYEGFCCVAFRVSVIYFLTTFPGGFDMHPAADHQISRGLCHIGVFHGSPDGHHIKDLRYGAFKGY